MNKIFQKYKKSKAFFISFCLPLGLTACDENYEQNSYLEDNKTQIESMKKDDVYFDVKALSLVAPPNHNIHHEWSLISKKEMDSNLYLDNNSKKIEKWELICDSSNIASYGRCFLNFADSKDDATNKISIFLQVRDLINFKMMFEDFGKTKEKIPEVNIENPLYFKSKYDMTEALSNTTNLKVVNDKFVITAYPLLRVFKVELTQKDALFISEQINNYIELTQKTKDYENLIFSRNLINN
jgi:hypothetical protein